MKELKSDILIIGGGLTGLVAAFALSSTNKKIILIDKFDFTNTKELTKDLRTTAVAEGSKIFFEKIGLWKCLKKYAEPIKNIKVFDRVEKNKINFSNPHHKDFLGYIIKNNIIKKTLVDLLLFKKNIKMINNASLNNLFNDKSKITTNINNFKISSQLLIAADGKNSFIRNFIKTPIYSKKYDHDALVININHKKNHKNTAYELFYETGPLAILPMQNNNKKLFSSSVIWSSPSLYASSIKNSHPDFLKYILEQKIINYTGEIVKINNVQKFNLSAHINSKFYEERIVYIGDSAHSIHPIAGQGWNLGIRDIKNILSSINEATNLGLDIGQEFVCKKYNDLSFYDSFLLYQITDKFNLIFLNDGFLTSLVRKKGFKLIENNKLIKNYISGFAMGI